MKTIKAAQPAMKRLEKAKYPGADWAGQQISSAQDAQDLGTVSSLTEALAMFRKSAGDRGAWEYTFYVDYFDQSVPDAADSIISEVGFDEAMPRLEALRQYAGHGGLTWRR